MPATDEKNSAMWARTAGVALPRRIAGQVRLTFLEPGCGKYARSPTRKNTLLRENLRVVTEKKRICAESG
jgi:hypothetical protein